MVLEEKGHLLSRYSRSFRQSASNAQRITAMFQGIEVDLEVRPMDITDVGMLSVL